jgi:hypothetical protein
MMTSQSKIAKNGEPGFLESWLRKLESSLRDNDITEEWA